MKTSLLVAFALCILSLLNIIFLKFLGTPLDTAFWQSMGMGLLPNIIGLIIAVFAVDAVIRLSRRSSFSKINHKYSQSVAYTTNRLILNILQELNLVEDDKTIVEALKSGGQLDIAKKISTDSELNFVIKDMRSHLSDGTFGQAVMDLARSANYLSDVERLSVALAKGINLIKKHLNNIQPYPSRLAHKLFEEDFESVASLMTLAPKIENELYGQKSLNLNNEQRQAMRSLILVEVGNKLQLACLELTYLSERARKNKIFDVID